MMASGESALIGHLGATLLDFIWQGAVIACAAGLAMAALRNSRPQARYAVACAALFACIGWPAVNLVARLTTPADAHGVVIMLALGGGAGTLHAWTLLDWLHAHLATVVLAWATCAGALALRMASGLWWIARAARSPRTDATWQARIDNMTARFGITRAVRLRIVDGSASPVTALWWRPVVLLPASLLTGMPPDLLEALIAHELAHVWRADYLVNLLQNVVEMLLFYHPAVWWLSHRIRIERERVADDLAAQHVGARQLARALFELEKIQFAHHDLALAANGGDLMSRIRRLLRPAQPGWNWKAALPVLGLTAALIAGCATPARAPVRTAAVIQFNSCKTPDYPKAAMRNEETGTVDMAFLVGTDGKVHDARIERSSGHVLLDDAARLSIAMCSFSPAKDDGVAVQSWAPVRYVWTLE